MYSERERLASAIWKSIEPLLKAAKSNGQPMSVRFDAKHTITVVGSSNDASEIFAAVDKAENDYDIQWNLKTISYIEKMAKEDGEINVEWKGDPDTGVYVDWSEYFEFSV